MSDCGHDQITLKLQERVKGLQAAITDQQKLITRLQATITDQQRRLSFYENSDSPPSRDSLEWRQEEKERGENRKKQGSGSGRGCVPNHPGKTSVLVATKNITGRPHVQTATAQTS